ncbi:hypothetical protein LCGC14_2453660 [marine sediment metagenome]|uniref:Uncharacterized protein n=1 Tax=marine sediment metagenome TaxID=412755 RepID=A0A0F9E975_9ZZZZ
MGQDLKHVTTVIGCRVPWSELSSKVELDRDVIQQPNLGGHGLHVDSRGNAFVCSWKRVQVSADDPQLAIYQDEDWGKERIRNTLELLGLWRDGQFGIWVIVE